MSEAPLTQDLVRGLFVNSKGHNATIQFSKLYPNVVCVMHAGGHPFDINFTAGLKFVLDTCRDNGVILDPSACRPVAAMDLPKPRETEEALDQQEKAFTGTGPVETVITPEIVEARQERANPGKPEKVSKRKPAQSAEAD